MLIESRKEYKNRMFDIIEKKEKELIIKTNPASFKSLLSIGSSK